MRYLLAAVFWLSGIVLSGCGGDDSGANGAYSVDCSSSATYSPSPQPLVTPSITGAATTSVIVMHGKTGTPYAEHLTPYYSALSSAGYDVIAPYMPWSTTNWTGSMCGAMNYLDSLVTTEADKGHDVIIAGHSMGGAYAFVYGATSPDEAVKGIIALAPGHFPHISANIQSASAGSITLAKEMIAAGSGDVSATFDIYNSGLTIQITATPVDYLSFHDLDQVPDVRQVLPTITLPLLWLVGDADPLTDFYANHSLTSMLTSSDDSYQIVSGDHKGMVSSAGTPSISWLQGLGL